MLVFQKGARFALVYSLLLVTRITIVGLIEIIVHTEKGVQVVDMEQPSEFRVVTKDGVEGKIWTLENNDPRVLVQFPNGLSMLLPWDTLQRRDDNLYYLPYTLADLARQRQTQVANETQAGGQEQLVVPVIAEELNVQRRMVESGKVRITKRVTEHEEVINEPLLREEVSVERVPVERLVDKLPDVRYEGDTMILPVVEEVLVVEKRLMLREEVRISRHQITVPAEPQPVTLRREEVQVERVDSEQQPER